MTALARLCLWCLRHAREPEVLVEQLGAWMDLVREVRRAPDGVAAVVLIMRYILEVSAPAQPDALVGRLAAGDEAMAEIVFDGCMRGGTVARWSSSARTAASTHRVAEADRREVFRRRSPPLNDEGRTGTSSPSRMHRRSYGFVVAVFSTAKPSPR